MRSRLFLFRGNHLYYLLFGNIEKCPIKKEEFFVRRLALYAAT